MNTSDLRLYIYIYSIQHKSSFQVRPRALSHLAHQNTHENFSLTRFNNTYNELSIYHFENNRGPLTTEVIFLGRCHHHEGLLEII